MVGRRSFPFGFLGFGNFSGDMLNFGGVNLPPNKMNKQRTVSKGNFIFQLQPLIFKDFLLVFGAVLGMGKGER